MGEFLLKELQLRVAANRDQTAYKKLFLHFYKPLISYSRVIVKTLEAAEEVVSDVMLNIWNLGEALLKVDNLTAYLHQATKNRSLGYASGKLLIKSIELPDSGLQVRCNNLNPAEAVQTAEMTRWFAEAIIALPAKCGLTYHLVKECGFTYKQTATALGISENTVDRHLNNALHKLINAMQSYLSEERLKQWRRPSKKIFINRVGRLAEHPVSMSYSLSA